MTKESLIKKLKALGYIEKVYSVETHPLLYQTRHMGLVFTGLSGLWQFNLIDGYIEYIRNHNGTVERCKTDDKLSIEAMLVLYKDALKYEIY